MMKISLILVLLVMNVTCLFVCMSTGEEMMYMIFRLCAQKITALFPDRKETVILCLYVLSANSLVCLFQATN
jgi:hypothetical protein